MMHINLNKNRVHRQQKTSPNKFRHIFQKIVIFYVERIIIESSFWQKSILIIKYFLNNFKLLKRAKIFQLIIAMLKQPNCLLHNHICAHFLKFQFSLSKYLPWTHQEHLTLGCWLLKLACRVTFIPGVYFLVWK